MASGDVFPKLLGGPVQLGTSDTSLITLGALGGGVPIGHQYTVKQIIVCNTDGVDRWFSLSLPLYASIAPDNCFVYRLPIAGYDTVVFDTGLILDAGVDIKGLSDVAAKVTVTITGWDREI